jgi:2-oxoglutaroyl-CoA hydrolase
VRLVGTVVSYYDSLAIGGIAIHMTRAGELMPQLVCQPLPLDLPADPDGFRVEYDEEDSRADIVLDRPPFNLVSLTQCAQLRATFEALEHDPAVRVIVVRTSGEHFSRGSDVDELADASPEAISQLAWNLSSPSRCSKPVIAANRGYCFGAGFELALACDFRIATETALYALPAQEVGQVPGLGCATQLYKLIGIGRMKDIVMRSRFIPGAQAYDWGIASEFAVDTELENATDALVRELLAFSPVPQRAAKKLLNTIEDAPRLAYPLRTGSAGV